jgi:hypothetical protein
MDLILIAIIDTSYPDNFIYLGKTANTQLCRNMGIKNGYSITFLDQDTKCYGIATFNDLDKCRIPPKFQPNIYKK